METLNKTIFQIEVDKIKENKGVLQQVSEDTFYHFLECVPPIYLKMGGFSCGEVYTHNENNIPVYYNFIQYDGKFYGIMATQGEAKLKFSQSANFNIDKV